MGDLTSVACLGLEPALADLVVDSAGAALAALELAGDLERLEICADDLAGASADATGAGAGDEGWFGPVAGHAGPGRAVTLYCAPAVFLAARPEARPAGPPTAVWERARGRQGDPAPAAADFARGRAEVFRHHQLLILRDLLRRELDPGLVPASLAEAFAAAWSITVDGRLHRAGLPGRAQDEQRRRFSGLFSRAGILMPEHWQIFEDLWEGVAAQQRDVLRQVRRLPRR